MRYLAAALLALACSGCASITRGTDEQIAFASTPSGATANVTTSSGPQMCMTPCAIPVKRSDDVTVTFEKAGYEPEVVVLQRDITTQGGAGFAGNLLLGGVIGMGVDAATGAATDHKPNPVIVTMRPLARAPEPRVATRPRAPARTAAPAGGGPAPIIQQ